MSGTPDHENRSLPENPLDNSSLEKVSAAENERLREMEIRAQVEAEESGAPRAPTELIFLMLAPIVMLALPLAFYLFAKNNIATAPTYTPSAPTTQGAPAAQTSQMSWNHAFETAQQMAQQTGKNMMVDFYSDT